MNMVLSFTNRVEALLYLPELLHVILLLAGNGTDATRHAIYGSAINLVHSLCTEDQREARKPKRRRRAAPRRWPSCSAARAARGTEAVKLFGLPAASQATSANAAFGASTEMVRDPPDNASIERLALLMYEVADAAAPSVDAANSWRARLTSLVTSTAFQYNPIIQSRAFVLLAAWRRARSTTTCCTRSGVAAGLDLGVGEQQLRHAMISIVTCLSKVVRILPTRSAICRSDLLGVAMVQCGHVPLFKAGAELMLATVETIWQRGIPTSEGSI